MLRENLQLVELDRPLPPGGVRVLDPGVGGGSDSGVPRQVDETSEVSEATAQTKLIEDVPELLRIEPRRADVLLDEHVPEGVEGVVHRLRHGVLELCPDVAIEGEIQATTDGLAEPDRRGLPGAGESSDGEVGAGRAKGLHDGDLLGRGSDSHRFSSMVLSACW